jgi:hypothetical protein
METIKFLLELIGIPSLVFALVLVFSKRYVSGMVDNVFQKKLVDHKHELDILTENVRFDYQKKIQEYGLYLVKRHEKYLELHQLIQEAYGWLDSLYGFRRGSTYEEHNKVDILAIMEQENFPKGKIEEITVVWDRDGKDKAIGLMKKFLRLIEFRKTEAAIIKARNFYFISNLFFSEKISKLTKRLVDNLHSAYSSYEMVNDLPVDDSESRKEHYSEANKSKSDSLTTLDELTKQLKKELSSATNPSEVADGN